VKPPAAPAAGAAWRGAAWRPSAYVSDELVLGVYAEENNQGQRLGYTAFGSHVETLAQSGDFTQVRLNDGTYGWVKSAFLTPKEPAVVRSQAARRGAGSHTRHHTRPGRGGGRAAKWSRLNKNLLQSKSELDAVRQRASSAAAAPQPQPGPARRHPRSCRPMGRGRGIAVIIVSSEVLAGDTRRWAPAIRQNTAIQSLLNAYFFLGSLRPAGLT